ncbi:MAG: hypothetical protein AAF357_03005 [Verrucomicrobiota bacterium]
MNRSKEAKELVFFSVFLFVKRLLFSCLGLALSSFAVAEDQTISESQQKWIKVYQKQTNIPQPKDMLVHRDPEPSREEGFRPLFNGKDLQGWTPLGGTCHFEALEGVIVGTCVKGSPSTYLSTDRADFGDFC